MAAIQHHDRLNVLGQQVVNKLHTVVHISEKIHIQNLLIHSCLVDFFFLAYLTFLCQF